MCLLTFLAAQQTIMRDKWMNIGHEDEELKPHIEPVKDYNDPVRIGNCMRLPTTWIPLVVDI